MTKRREKLTSNCHVEHCSQKEEIESLRKTVKRWKCCVGIVTTIITILGYFGYSFYNSFQEKCSLLKNEANQIQEQLKQQSLVVQEQLKQQSLVVQKQYNDAKNQLLQIDKNYLELNGQFINFSAAIATEQKNIRLIMDELSIKSTSALTQSEDALKNAGNLDFAIKVTQKSADEAAISSKLSTDRLKQIEEHMKKNTSNVLVHATYPRKP